jgi:hypothetical protein
MEFTTCEEDPNICILTSTPGDSHARALRQLQEKLGDELSMGLRGKR